MELVTLRNRLVEHSVDCLLGKNRMQTVGHPAVFWSLVNGGYILRG